MGATRRAGGSHMELETDGRKSALICTEMKLTEMEWD